MHGYDGSGACGANTAFLADKIVGLSLRFCLNASSDGSFAHVFPYGVFFPQQLRKVLRIVIWLDRLHDLLQQGHVLVLSHLLVETALVLQLGIVLRHELLHLAHHVVVPVLLNRLLIILQLPREEVRLGVLELNCVALFRLLVYLVGDAARGCCARNDLPILHLVCIDEPNIVTVVLHELR